MNSRSTAASPLQTYVVRIYRRAGDDESPHLAGTVEPVPGGDRLAFDSLGQLGDILGLPPTRANELSRNGGDPR